MNNTETELAAAMDRLSGALELMRTSGEVVGDETLDRLAYILEEALARLNAPRQLVAESNEVQPTPIDEAVKWATGEEEN